MIILPARRDPTHHNTIKIETKTTAEPRVWDWTAEQNNENGIKKTISNKSLLWPLCTVEMLDGIINIRELCSFVTNKNGVNSLFISYFVLFFLKLKQVLSALPGPAQSARVRLKFHPRSRTLILLRDRCAFSHNARIGINGGNVDKRIKCTFGC